MTNKKVKSPHDLLFRGAMQYPEVAREFLEAHLPETIKKRLDFSSIKALPTTFIDEELKLKQSDVLLQAKFLSGEDVYLYALLEHQTKSDSFMALRLLSYMTKIWEHHIKKFKKEALPLPVILPIVVFTGKNYNAARSIWELCGSESNLMHDIITSPYGLIDINMITEEAMRARLWSGTLEFVMRHRFKQQFIEGLQAIADNLNHLVASENSRLVNEVLNYIVSVDDEHRTLPELIEILHNRLSPETEDIIMSLADNLREEGKQKGISIGIEKGRQEGRKEGIEKGILQTAKNMLKKKFELVVISEVTGLPIDTIKTLQ